MSNIKNTCKQRKVFHIIEDESLFRNLLSEVVHNEGYHAITFESGNHYLEYLHSDEFRYPVAILTDVQMPGIKGYDLVRTIHENNPLQKIILMTGDANSDKIAHIKDCLCHILEKPFNIEELIHLLASLEKC